MESAFGAEGVVSAQTLQVHPKLMYNRREAAQMLSVSVRTIDYLIHNRELTVRRIGSRRLIPYQSLLQCTRRDSKGRVQ